MVTGDRDCIPFLERSLRTIFEDIVIKRMDGFVGKGKYHEPRILSKISFGIVPSSTSVEGGLFFSYRDVHCQQTDAG